MRDLSPAFRERVERPHSDAVPLWFITIDHADLAEPIRAVSDTLTVDGEPGRYLLGGHEYVCCPFRLVPLTDGEEAPRASIELPNVERVIGDTIRRLSTAPRFEIRLYDAADWDRDTHPRQPLDEPFCEFEARHLRLVDAKVDAMSVSAGIASWDYSQEPWPSIRAVQGLLPALFR
jgi:hypothetical protein